MQKYKPKTSQPRVSNLVGTRWCGDVFCKAWEGSCPVLDKLRTFFQQSDEITCAAVAYETGVHGVHPHWQYYFETATKCRMKQKLASLLGEDSGFHLEIARGTRMANLKYIWAVTKEHELGWVHYSKNCEPPDSYRSYKTDNLLRLHYHMKPWQRQIVDTITKETNYRDILWVYEPTGNTGKSHLAKYLHYFHGAIITGGKGEDMKYAIARWKQITGHYPVTIIIDLARSDNIPKNGYKTIEQIKNALFFSGKYQSGMVASCCPPNILVFANVPPVTKAMSSDRWKIKKIDPDTEQLVDQTAKFLA